MEGHHAEGHNVSRSDNISSEGFGSGDDHSRQLAFKENGEGKIISDMQKYWFMDGPFFYVFITSR